MVWSDQLKQLWGNLLALGPRRLAVLGLADLAAGKDALQDKPDIGIVVDYQNPVLHKRLSL